MNADLIAPCGMNCAVCRAYLRPLGPCRGCRWAGLNRPKTRVNCRLRTCEKRGGRFCFDCPDFPCERLKNLDRRYRTRYGMSEIKNLLAIQAGGIRRFVAEEKRKWISAAGVLCVHDKKRYPREK